MTMGRKTIQKMDRLERAVKRRAPDYEKVNKQEETMSHKVKRLVAAVQRKADRVLGIDVVAKKIKIAFKVVADQIDRHDFGGSDFALRVLLTKSGLPEINTVTTIADIAGVAEITNIATVADVAGSLNNKYFLINSALNTTGYYVWYNVSTGGTDPLVAGRTGIMVAIATNDTANTIATATRAAMINADFATSGATNHVIVTNNATGATTDASDGTAPTGFTIMVTQQGVTAASLAGKYFVLYDSSGSVAVWYKVSGSGSAPGGFTRTLEVDISTGASANTVASTTNTAVNADAQFDSAVLANVVTITSAVDDNFSDAYAGTSGFAIAKTQEGLNPEKNLDVAAGDLIEVLDGTLKKNTYAISSISGNYLRLDSDLSGYLTETNVHLQVMASTVKPGTK